MLLRFLDTFEGCLFITSNRVAAFDDAVLSRVTLAFRYEALQADGRTELWRSVLNRMGCQTANFDLQYYSSPH